MSTDNEMKETKKKNIFVKFFELVGKGIRYLFAKSKALFIFIATGIISFLFIAKVGSTSVKVVEKKEDIKDAGEDISNDVKDASDIVSDMGNKLEETTEEVNATEIEQTLKYNENNKTQKEQAESLGFAKVEE